MRPSFPKALGRWPWVAHAAWHRATEGAQMAALTNLFGEYASDEEGEASGDLQGALRLGSALAFPLAGVSH